ncbi:MAG: MFS transporter [Pseudomonadota bacterium]
MSSPLRARTLSAYAAPMIPLGALHFPVFVFVVPFYAAQGADLELLAAYMVAARLLDAATDPAMGLLSDRVRTPWGRRKPWMALAAPLLLAAAFALFVPPEGASATYAGLALGALTLAWTMALTPYQAWGAELSGDYAERARITSWREAAGLVGMLAAAILYQAGSAQGDAGLGLFYVFCALLVLVPTTFAAALRGAPQTPDLSRRRLAWREGLSLALSNRPFLRLLGAWLINGAANALPAALFLFFVEHRLDADGDTGATLLVVYFLSAVAGAPLWAWAARRAPKHRVWCGAMLYACAVFLWALTLGSGDVAAFTAICVLSGLAFGADLSLPPAMQADVVDADAAATGEQRTGVFFAVWSIATKSAQAAGAGAALYLLASAGFDATLEANDAGALQALTWLYAGVPVALKLAAVALMWSFPLDAAAQAEARARLEAEARPAA